MRWVVLGARGMLGTDLVRLLDGRGDDVRALGRADVDVTDPDAVQAAVAGADAVVNLAAWTAVDAAEAEEPAAFAVNAVGAAHVARSARAAGARAVHVSTDYVFDGRSTTPYAEDAPCAPRSAYGRTKLAGEWAVRAEDPRHLVVRTAWLYGAHGPCFPRTIARVAAERGSVSVVTDQVGQPTWTVDVAGLLVALVDADVPAGTYHATASGRASWFEFAREVVAAVGLDPETVGPTTTEAFPRPAPRPPWSVLGHDALGRVGVTPIGDWSDRWRVAAPEVLGAG